MREKLNKRMTDENEILNFVARRPDLLAGPGGGKYGSSNFVINCPTIGFTKEEPIIDQVAPENDTQS